MKKLTLLAAALLMSACGDKGADNTAATSNEPLTPIAAPNGGDWTKTVAQTAEGGMLLGNPNAKVKLIEFGSMTCPHCAEFSEKGSKKLTDEYVKSGQVSWEFRNFVRDPVDITMSLIARCAGATPQFFTLTESMYADQAAIFERYQATPPAQLQGLQSLPAAQQFQQIAKLAGLQEWAAQRGLPSGRTSQCLANQGEIERLVRMQTEAVDQFNVPGTPAFVINGELATETATWEALEPKLREALGS
jgi:protein-disulfide isomerase